LQEGLEQGLEKGLEQGLEQGLEKGLEKGRQEKAEQTALNLLKIGVLTKEQIAEVTGLSLDRVESL